MKALSVKSLLYAIVLSVGCACVAVAQQAGPPSDLDEAKARADAAEAQSSYLLTHIRHQAALDAAQRQAEAKKADDTAAWWADYLRGLSATEKSR